MIQKISDHYIWKAGSCAPYTRDTRASLSILLIPSYCEEILVSNQIRPVSPSERALRPLQCAICGGKATATELGEALVQAVLQTDGFIEAVAPDNRLTAYDGVGALLRCK